MGIGKYVKGTRGNLDILRHYQFDHGEFEKIGHSLRKSEEDGQTADFSTQLAP